MPERWLPVVGFETRYLVSDHCKNGHEFTPENTRWFEGWRRCRTCQRIRGHEYDRRRRCRADMVDMVDVDEQEDICGHQPINGPHTEYCDRPNPCPIHDPATADRLNSARHGRPEASD